MHESLYRKTAAPARTAIPALATFAAPPVNSGTLAAVRVVEAAPPVAEVTFFVLVGDGVSSLSVEVGSSVAVDSVAVDSVMSSVTVSVAVSSASSVDDAESAAVGVGSAVSRAPVSE